MSKEFPTPSDRLLIKNSSKPPIGDTKLAICDDISEKNAQSFNGGGDLFEQRSGQGEFLVLWRKLTANQYH